MSNCLKLERVVRGFISRVNEPGNYVIQTAEEWEELHKLHTDGKSPSEYGLEYDFSSFTLVAVFLGTVPPRSAIKITAASELEDKIQVEVQQNITGNSGNYWHPYDIVRIPKVTKPIEFEYHDNPHLTVSDVRSRD